MVVKKIVGRAVPKKALPSEINQFLEELGSSESLVRISRIFVLRKMKDKRVLPAIKKSVFDFDRGVRACAADALAEFIGWKSTIEFIKRRFRQPGAIPRAFFADRDQMGGERKFRRWRQKDWRALREQAAIDARRQGYFERMKDKSGKPFSVNGIPVFLGELGNDLGIYTNGLLIVEKNPKILNPKDREPIAWHEFGETFSHRVGNAFELDYLERTGQLKDYLKRNKEKRSQLMEIIKNW